MRGNGAAAERDGASQRRGRRLELLVAMFLGACGRIGYDDFEGPTDASTTQLDVGAIDGDPPVSEVSVERGADVGVDLGDGLPAEDGEGGPAEGGTCTGGPFPLLHWNVAPAPSVASMDMEFKVT